MGNLNNSKTKTNLMRAFAGESQARNRYTFASYLAKQNKLEVLEKAFLYTAEQERAHAKVFYDHLKELTGDNISLDSVAYPVEVYDDLVQTLKAAQHDEYQESDDVYKEFAKIAKEEGFTAVAESFEKISTIEKVHGDRFGKLAEKMENGTLFKSDKEEQWICLNCGYIYTGTEVPKACPVCRYPQGYYMLYSESLFE